MKYCIYVINFDKLDWSVSQFTEEHFPVNQQLWWMADLLFVTLHQACSIPENDMGQSVCWGRQTRACNIGRYIASFRHVVRHMFTFFTHFTDNRRGSAEEAPAPKDGQAVRGSVTETPSYHVGLVTDVTGHVFRRHFLRRLCGWWKQYVLIHTAISLFCFCMHENTISNRTKEEKKSHKMPINHVKWYSTENRWNIA